MRAATTSEVASDLGLATTTVQKYAQQGRIPFDTTPGGHRRFDVDEVRQALAPASDLRDAAVAAIRERVTGWSVAPVHVSVFGSVARASAGPDSDLDVFVVRPAGIRVIDPVWSRQRLDLVLGVRSDVGRPLDLSEYGVDDLAREIRAGRRRFLNGVADEGVLVAGTALAPLLADLAVAS